MPKDHIPLGVVKISCIKEKMVCADSFAIVYGATITPEILWLDVKSWTPTQIVLEPWGDDCVRAQIIIDRVAKRVTQVIRNDPKGKSCTKFALESMAKEPARYTLDLVGDSPYP